MIYYHVDVFSKGPLTGNGLTVLICDTMPPSDIMQNIAKEMKQFETIFLCKRSRHEYDARIFTIDEELQFAGHPILGASAAVMNEERAASSVLTEVKFDKIEEIIFNLPGKVVPVKCNCISGGTEYECTMNQGVAEVIETIDRQDIKSLINPINIDFDDLDTDLPLEVCSTGLPYLIVPVKSGIEKAGIYINNYEEVLKEHGASFVYVLDVNNCEARTFDNNGNEDVATGSAAGPGGDYLIRHGICAAGQTTIINQGRFLGRPSKIFVSKEDDGSMIVSGNVSILARGIFNI